MKKILKTLAMIGICLSVPLLLTGCTVGNENKTNPQNFRVQDGRVQFTQDGETWINLIEAEYPISEYDFRIYNGYVQWTTDGETWTNIIKAEEEPKTYTITYDYGVAKDLFGLEPPETSIIEENTWVMSLPEIYWLNEPSFKGWFIQGTDKQISKYDYIAGDITLEARFDFASSYAPAGLYENGKYIKTWQKMLEDGNIVVEDGVLDSAWAEGDLKIDNTITEIGNQAITSKQWITGVAIPDSVKTIGNRAFDNCKNLSNVTIGNSVKIIDYMAFNSCEKLTSITIPGNVVMIEEYAFQGCDNLTSINLIEREQDTWKIYDALGFILSEDVLSLTEKKLVSYLKNGYEFKQICWQNGFGLDYISVNLSRIVVAPVSDKTIAEAVIVDYFSFPATEIDDFAFYDCNNLTNITIPDSIMEIGVDAFRSCDSLTAITFEEKEGYKWQVYDNNDWRDAEASELFDLAKAGKELKRVSE